jgi:hypothetical protein
MGVCGLEEMTRKGYKGMVKKFGFRNFLVTGRILNVDENGAEVIGVEFLITEDMDEQEALRLMKSSYDRNLHGCKRRRHYWLPLNNPADTICSYMDTLGAKIFGNCLRAFGMTDYIDATIASLRKNGQADAAADLEKMKQEAILRSLCA